MISYRSADIFDRFKQKQKATEMHGWSLLMRFYKRFPDKWRMDSIIAVNPGGETVEHSKEPKFIKDLQAIIMSNLEFKGWYKGTDNYYYYNTHMSTLGDLGIHGVVNINQSTDLGNPVETFYINVPKAFEAYIQ